MHNFQAWRPDSLKDFEGQDALKREIAVELAASRQMRRPLASMVLHGPPGLGKTSFAALLAKERGVPFIRVLGEGLTHEDLTKLLVEDFYHHGCRAGYDMHGVLTSPEQAVFPVLCVDECDRLSRGLLELFHTLLEPDNPQGILTFQAKYPETGEVFTAWVPRFSALFLTNYLGDLASRSQPTLSRFKIIRQFQWYDDDQAFRVVLKQARANRLVITEDAACLIASRSNGMPRTICNLLERAVDYMVTAGESEITPKVVQQLLTNLEIDHNGFDPAMRAYLQYLTEAPNGRLSLQSLAGMLGSDPKTLEICIEPALQRRRLIVRGCGGRTLTAAGRAILGGSQKNFDVYRSARLS